MPLGVLKDIRKIYNGLNANGIREEASRELAIGLLATSGEVYREMEDFLVPAHLEDGAREQALRLDLQGHHDQRCGEFRRCFRGHGHHSSGKSLNAVCVPSGACRSPRCSWFNCVLTDSFHHCER